MTAILHRGLRNDFLFFQFQFTFSLFSLDFYFPFLFGLLFPFSLWSFISLFSLDVYSITVTFWLFSNFFFRTDGIFKEFWGHLIFFLIRMHSSHKKCIARFFDFFSQLIFRLTSAESISKISNMKNKNPVIHISCDWTLFSSCKKQMTVNFQEFPDRNSK